ncbi:LysR family transcriptional regulator [Marinovum sp.]|uniref:LysR family transcriptional regulator n=1 Tax=Marinovum sp. TaxID=2024839 RepID=UPI002B27C134|nr:LysR family transcriptional regulator [Marinovum sp.]
MELRQLEYFLAAVEQRSLGRAAEVMNISQPAISKAIRRLEIELGVSLLDRRPRGVETTAFGDVLALRGTSIRHALMRVEDELRAMKSGHTGKVTIGVGSSMRLKLLPDAILRVKSSHPNVEYKVVSKLHDGLMPDVQRGDVELALCQLATPDVVDELAEIPLYSDSIRPTVRKGHPLLRKPDLRPIDCLDYDWILPAAEHLGHRRLDARFHDLGFPAPKPVVESESTLFSISMIKSSDMISWHPTLVIQEFSDHVAAIPLPEISMPRKVGIVHRSDMQFSAPAKLLIEQLQNVSREMIDSGLADPITPG